MSIFGTLDCSFSSQVLQKARTRGYSMLLDPTYRRRTDTHIFRRPCIRNEPKSAGREAPAQQFERIFIRALVQAGHCHGRIQRQKSERLWITKTSSEATKSSNGSLCRHFTSNTRRRSASEATAAAATEYAVSRDELKRLVDYYPPLPGDPESSADLTVGPSTDYGSVLSPPPPQPASDLQITSGNLSSIQKHLQRLLEDKESPHEEVFAVYEELPYPRALNIPLHTIRSLLHHLSIVEYKSHTSMLRYLAVVEDVKAADIPLTVTEWTSAISFTGRCFRKITAADVESSLNLWREMENEAGVQASAVTFNVLFDIASKAGKFVLAEMIAKEMQRRGLAYNRHFRTGLIYHYGLRADGDGVRRAYRELVEAGEIVDAAVIACVIASLLKCGEAVAAEQVFARAKDLHSRTGASDDGNSNGNSTTAPPPPPQHWRARRDLGRFLDRAATRLRGNPDAVRQLQASLSLAPDFRAYKALLYHHAVTAGDMDRVTELVAEMDAAGVPLHGVVFLYLLKGFGMHGGVLYTSWTRRRLEGTWAAFLRAVAAPGGGVYVGRAAAVLVLRAFAKCAPYERVLEVWGEVRGVWEPGEQDLNVVEELLASLREMDDGRGGDDDDVG